MKPLQPQVVALIAGVALWNCSDGGEPLSTNITEKIVGQSREELKQKYGEPSKQYTYRASEASGEFRGHIVERYPPDDPTSFMTEVLELWWDQGDYILTAWFSRSNGKWSAIHGLKWRKDLVF